MHCTTDGFSFGLAGNTITIILSAAAICLALLVTLQDGNPRDRGHFIGNDLVIMSCPAAASATAGMTHDQP